jgi:DNA-binding response OmpR family regulator
MKINPKLGNIGLFTSNCVDLFMVNAKEKNIALHFSADNINDLILFDEEKWEKIIFNLVSNALKYTDPGGTVTVQLSYQPGDAAEPEKCLLSVTDTGRGIAQDQLERIFDRFYTINEDRQQSKQGTGIGLSLVSELAELMQGKVSVRSREGEGSFFEVWIPVKKAKSRQDLTEAKSRPAPVVSTTSLTDQKIILVAEDNEELRNFIADGLANRWKILTATNGRDAWDKTVNELPDIIISDLMMPGMDGAEFCRMVKNDMRTGHIGFIMLTARTAQESRYNSLESGADIYLTKPFHFEELEQRITNLLLQQERMRTHLIQHALPATPMSVVPHVIDIFIQQIQKILDEKIGDTKISVEMLATAMHLSQRTLHRKLKAILNISPVEFIKQYRLQKACVLLTSGHAITDTAYSVGFETASYFSQCFKEHFGKTPSEFALQQSA